MSHASFYVKILLHFSLGRGNHICAIVRVWRSGNNLQESVLSFHQVGPGYWTQIVRLGSNHLWAISASLFWHFFVVTLRKCELVHVALSVFQLDDTDMDLSTITRALSGYWHGLTGEPWSADSTLPFDPRLLTMGGRLDKTGLNDIHKSRVMKLFLRTRQVTYQEKDWKRSHKQPSGVLVKSMHKRKLSP